MLVVLRSLEILLLFGALGLPVTMVLLSGAKFSSEKGGISTPVLLAPLTGFVVFILICSAHFALGGPVNAATGSFWPLLAGFWLVLAVIRFRRTPRGLRGWRFSQPGSAHFWTLGGLVLVLGIYLLPFLRNQDLVHWHYAGTDGYMYMQESEYLGRFGSGRIPEIGAFDAALGFIHSVVVDLHSTGFLVDRPGTVASLAGLAALLGLLPQEAFSPLAIAAVGLFYLSLVLFGAHLGLPWQVSALFGLFGACSMVIWQLQTGTFLGNLLAMPIVAALLLLSGLELTPPTAAYGGIVLAGLLWLFPDIAMAAVGMPAAIMLVRAGQARLAGRLRPFLGSLAVGLLVATTLALPNLRNALYLALARAQYVVPMDPSSLPGAPSGSRTSLIQPLATWDWVWPAFNLNTLPPQPLKPDEVPFVAALGVLLVLFLGLAAWHRRPLDLWSYTLILVLLLLVGGIAGQVSSDYALYRALGIFAFVPLAALFVLPALTPRRLRRIPQGLLALAVGAVLLKFAINDFGQFQRGYEAQAPETRYTSANMRDRAEVERLAHSRTVVLASETPTFTALASVVMLFSSTHLGIPPAYHKFVFFERPDYPAIQRDAQYTADLVLRNRNFPDIDWPGGEQPALYRSDDFEVAENDLVLFFDHDTFPTLNPFSTAFLQRHSLAVARTLKEPTEIAFFSQVDRAVRVGLQFAPEQVPTEIRFTFDGGPPETLEVPPTGQVWLPDLPARQGLHKLVLESPAGPARVTGMSLLDLGRR